MSRERVLERAQRLDVPVERAFAFYGDARNLEALTPPWLRFRVTSAPGEQLHAGALIEYRLKLHGVPVRWRTRIEVWEPPVRFVDVQLSGPYALWEHTHTFAPAARGAVEIRDRVRYRIPLGPLGDLAHALFIRADLERIFDYRRDAVAALLGG